MGISKGLTKKKEHPAPCGASKETVHHFLFVCPSYTHKWWALERSLKRRHKTLSLANLLSDPASTAPLVNYISATLKFIHKANPMPPITNP
jgi:hypothetical protein